MSDSDGAKFRMIRWQHGSENEPPIQQITFYGNEAIVEFAFGEYRELYKFTKDSFASFQIERIGERRDTRLDRIYMDKYSDLMKNMGK